MADAICIDIYGTDRFLAINQEKILSHKIHYPNSFFSLVVDGNSISLIILYSYQ
jgi:hypothetical protein